MTTFIEAVAYDCGYSAAEAANAKRVAELEAALSRQADNMAFVLNHASLPDQWYEKFLNELALDRTALGDAL